MEVLKDVGKALGVQLDEHQVAAAHRIPSYNKERTQGIVVKFNNRAHKEAWTAAARTKKKLTAKEVNPAFSDSVKIYVSDHLSPDNKRLLAEAKKVCKNVGYSFTWCTNTKIFVRKNVGDTCIRIARFSDLSKIK